MSMPLTEWSNMHEWRTDPIGSQILRDMDEKGERGELPQLLKDNAAAEMFLDSMPINSLTVLMGKDGARLTAYMLEAYARATS